MPQTCGKCGKEGADKKCGKCFVTSYCSRDCQREHWKVHKRECGKLANGNRDTQDQNGTAAKSTVSAGEADVHIVTSAPKLNVTESASQEAQEDTSSAPQIQTEPAAVPTPASTSAPAATTDAAAAVAAPATPAATSDAGTPTPAPAGQRRMIFPSKPYSVPANLSVKGKEAYEQLKAILDGPADQIVHTIVKTPFSEATDETTRRVDVRIVPKLMELLIESMKADPTSALEVFKRFIAVKSLIKRPDDPSFANWCSVIGQQCLVQAQEVRVELAKQQAPGKDPNTPVKISPEVMKAVQLLRMDALMILMMGNHFFDTAFTTKPESLGNMPVAIAHKLHTVLRVTLAFAYRHSPDPKNARLQIWREIAEDDGEHAPDPLMKGLSSYALAFEACKREDTEQFSKYIKQAQDIWKALDNDAMPKFIERHISMGICKQCVIDMAGVMDGNELRFKQSVSSHIRATVMMENPQAAANAQAAQAAQQKDQGGSSKNGGQGARLVPGRPDEKEDRAAAASSSAAAKIAQKNAQQAQAGLQALRDAMAEGYRMYEEGKMEAGVEHFGKLLKKVFDLPQTGMTISLVFSMSHAHIEGAAQLRRWGKAEGTIGKLREIAESAEKTKIPHAVEDIADRLHLWWREKQANIYSRQRKFDKAIEVLDEAVQHAQALSGRHEAGIMVLLVASHVECFLSGSPKADLSKMQTRLDRGIAALRANPPPVGGAPHPNGQTPSGQWAADTKLEQWIKMVPMLRSLESEGVSIGEAEAVLPPLAEKFNMDVGHTVMNAEQFVQTAMKSNRGLLGGRSGGRGTGTTVLFGIATMLPLLLIVWLVVYTLTTADDADDDYDVDLGSDEM